MLNNLLTFNGLSVFTDKSQTLTLLQLVWDFPLKTSLPVNK